MSVYGVPRNVPKAAFRPNVGWVQAVVTAVGTGVVDLAIEGGTLDDVPHLAGYSPTVDDVVECLSSGSRLIVLGVLA